MSTTAVIWVALLSGAGTFLIRFLPMQWHEKGAQNTWSAQGSLRNALDAMGPAAIVALLVAELWSMVLPASFLHDIIPVAAGLAGVAIGKRFLHGIAWATLTGVVVYGLAIGMLWPELNP